MGELIVGRGDKTCDLGLPTKQFNKLYVHEILGDAGDDLAKKASPAFTGTPTAPTAPGGTSTTQIATTKFVIDEIVEAIKGTIIPETDGTADLGSASKEYDQIFAKRLGGTLANLVAMNDTSQRGTAYSVGDTVRMPGIPVNMYLECITGGTTGATAPVITTPIFEGQTITDGSVEWTVKKCFPTSGGALTGTSLTWNGDNLGDSAIVYSFYDSDTAVVKLKSGLIIQTAGISFVSGSPSQFSITFPIAFRWRYTMAFSCAYNASGGLYTLLSKSMTGVTVKNIHATTGEVVYWMAIGW